MSRRETGLSAPFAGLLTTQRGVERVSREAATEAWSEVNSSINLKLLKHKNIINGARSRKYLMHGQTESRSTEPAQREDARKHNAAMELSKAIVTAAMAAHDSPDQNLLL